MPPLQGETHEGSHQEGGLGSTCANARADGNAGDRELHLLLAVTAVNSCSSESIRRRSERKWQTTGIAAALNRFTEIRNEASGERGESRHDLVSDAKIVVAVRHHAEALGGIDENDVVRHVRACFRSRRAADQGCGVNGSGAARSLVERVRHATASTEGSTEILQAPAAGAGLIDNGMHARGPIRRWLLATHRTRSRNMLTWDDNTPPSPCSSAIEAS